MTLILSFLWLLPRILLGYWIVNWIWRSTDERTLLIKVFSSGAVGFGISSLAAFLWIWAGLPLLGYAITETAFALGLTLFMLVRNGWKIPPLRLSLSPLGRDAIWLLLLALGALFFTIGSILVVLEIPHGNMDAWMNWNVVSRFIFLGGPDWKDTFLRQLDHPDYPLFITISNALTWSLLKNNPIWGPIAFHMVIGFFAAGLLFSLVYKFKGLPQACLVTILFMTQPLSFESSMSQYADFPLAYLILCAGGFMLLHLSHPEIGTAILSGFFAGLVAWTKNEGLPFIFIISLAWLVIGMRVEWKSFRNYLLGLLPPTAIVFLFKLFLAPSNDIVSGAESVFENLLDFQRYMKIIDWGGSALAKLGGGPISLTAIILVYMLIVGRAKERVPGHWIVGGIILAQLLVYMAIYLITPHDLEWHLKTSLSRLFLHVFPLTMLWLFIWLKAPEELQ